MILPKCREIYHIRGGDANDFAVNVRHNLQQQTMLAGVHYPELLAHGGADRVELPRIVPDSDRKEDEEEDGHQEQADVHQGDEDQGQMGAWFVMSALGIFQMDGG